VLGVRAAARAGEGTLNATPQRPDPRALYARAVDALNRREWPLAQRLAAEVAPHAPRHGGVHFVAGVAALQLQQLPLAVGHLRRAVEYSPGRADYLAQYARALASMHRLHEAVETADRAMALPCDDAMVWDTLGVVYSRAQAHGPAADAFGRAVALMPGHANFRFNLGTSYIFHGDIDAAEREYEACVAADPAYWRGYLALSQLRRCTREHNHVERMQALLARHPDEAEAQLYLHMSLAKELEDFGEYERAFDHYAAGKAVQRAKMGPSAERDAATFAAVQRWFDRPLPEARGHDSEEPIFVIGMPRSGTTLTDRILSAHGQVHSAGELANFGIALQRATGRPARGLLDTVASLDPAFDGWEALGRAYVESTRPSGTGSTPRFVDKLPHNFLYAGFIARALPKARIVCLRRDPMDTCLSNFRQLFAPDLPNYAYSLDLLDTGRYYLLFDRLMAFWRQLMPGRILELRYEDLVDDQEGRTRELLAFCGLPWDEACLRFEDNEAPVATASAVQVRSGMNRGSVQRWKRYGDRLDELRALLAEGGVRVDD
jgi:Flp pilus assembly protein TadD